MCYCRYLHHLCCEASEFHLLSLKMKHHLGLYYIQQNCHENKISNKDWYVSLWRKEFRCCSWLWIWLRVCLFHYYYYFGHVFLVKKKMPMTPNSQKAIFFSLLTENNNLKQETIFVLFANCDHWISVLRHQWKNMCTFKHSQAV